MLAAVQMKTAAQPADQYLEFACAIMRSLQVQRCRSQASLLRFLDHESAVVHLLQLKLGAWRIHHVFYQRPVISSNLAV